MTIGGCNRVQGGIQTADAPSSPLANPADFAGMNEEYVKMFATDPPARAVTKLGVELPNVLVSIMMAAHFLGRSGELENHGIAAERDLDDAAGLHAAACGLTQDDGRRVRRVVVVPTIAARGAR